MIQIFNSLSKKKEDLNTICPNQIKLYACGITIYDYVHIGHARTFVALDMIVRYLRYCGFDVIYVRNITDIDDKIIRRAAELCISTEALVAEFIAAMHEDFAALNMQPPSIEPRATESITDIIEMIQRLIAQGFAYPTCHGDVYYRVNNFLDYGALSRQNLDFLKIGARIEVGEDKENPLDFSLWKTAKIGEPSWNSPWSKGRPGWHIECSAMSKKTLGAHFDIHAGGADLKFPHHENEIAQSEAANGCKFANTWLHTGLVQVNQEKMSKSLNNFFTIREVLQHYRAEVVRYFLIAGHYRSEIHYDKSNLDNANAALERLYRALAGVNIGSALPPDETFTSRFKHAMDDDFNSPKALAILFEIVKKINTLKISDSPLAGQYALLLKTLGNVLGLLEHAPDLFLKSNLMLDELKINALIAARLAAKVAKDWVRADQLRLELIAMGLSIEDHSTGTNWSVNRLK